MRPKTWLLLVIIFVIGCLNHFIYAWLGEPIFLVPFSPTSESIFEHMKLAMYPTLLLHLAFPNNHRKVLSAFVMTPIVQPFMFYFLEHGLGMANLYMDILLLFITQIVGLWLGDKLIRTNRMALILSILLIVFVTFCSICPPNLPLFMVHSH